MEFSTLTQFCNAFILLMKPLVEIVIHDLDAETIAYINGDISMRKVGDPSLLDSQELEENLDRIVYPKLSHDGRLIKSISVPIDKKWLVCINCDVSVFGQMEVITQQFLRMIPEKCPESLFKNDWQERLHVAIHAYLKEKSWNYQYLTGRQKKEVAHHLFQIGAFAEKHAADYVASALNMGRATIFNYLKEWRTR